MTDRRLARGIGRLDATALVVGSMIGSGIFMARDGLFFRRLGRLNRAYPWLQLGYAAAGLALIAALLAGNPGTTWPGYVLLASGVPVFFLWNRRA